MRVTSLREREIFETDKKLIEQHTNTAMKKILITTITIVFLTCQAYSQVDREFWFAFPDITEGDYGAQNSAFLTIITFSQPTTINISQPAGFPGAIDTTITIPANSTWRNNFATDYLSQIEISPGSEMPFGFHIVGNNDFAAYYSNTSNDSEIYTLKGKNAMGKNFLVPMQYEYTQGNYAPSAVNSIEILATEDSTTVDVEVFVQTTELMQVTPHHTFHLTLNKGWAYAFAGKFKTGSDHLYGTIINSDKPIVVNSTDDSVNPGDLVGDQLTPISLAGEQYIAVRNSGAVEKVYIFPTENNTTISVDGIPLTGTFNKGDKTMVDLKNTNEATYISSNIDHPIVVFQVTSKNNSSELGGVLLPRLECTGSFETVYSRAFTTGELYFNIVTKQENVGAFTVNGQAGVINASDFSTVPQNPDYKYCRKNLTNIINSAPQKVARIANSLGYFHVAAWDNPGGNSCTYGYFSDYHNIRLNVVSALPNYTPGDVIHLYMTNASSFNNIQWTKPDGTVVNADEINIPNPTIADAGLYAVTATSKDGCTIEEDGVVVVNFVLPSSSSTTVCQGESVELIAKGYAPYKWLPTSETVQTINVQPANTTVYEVNNSKIAQNIVYNGNFQKNNIMFQSDYGYGGTSTTAVTTTNKYSVWRSAKEVNATYNRIYDHTTNSGTDGRFLIANSSNKPKSKIWTRKVDVVPNTQYEFAAWFIGALRGGSKAKLHFSVNNEPVGNVIEMTDPGSTPTSTTWKPSSCTWLNTTGVTAEISIEVAEDSPNGAGVCIDDITFRPLLAITDTFNVNVVEMPKPAIKGDTIICQGSAVLHAGKFPNGTPFGSYSWYKNDDYATQLSTDSIYTATEPGKYIVKVTNDICDAIDTFSVAPANLLKISMDTTYQICPDEPNFSLPYNLDGGELASYEISYDSIATANGFLDVINQPVLGNQIDFSLPNNVVAGTYNAQVKVISNSACADSKQLPVKITVKIKASDLMAQKWNDVISLFNKDYNGGYSFTSYQWYKNGLPIVGETNSYIYLGSGIQLNPNDKYSVLLTRDNGEEFLTCDFIPQVKMLVPTLVSPSQVISLQNMSATGIATFSDISGLTYSRQMIDENNAQIQAPAKKGLYILNIIINNETLKMKMFVR